MSTPTSATTGVVGSEDGRDPTVVLCRVSLCLRLKREWDGDGTGEESFTVAVGAPVHVQTPSGTDLWEEGGARNLKGGRRGSERVTVGVGTSSGVRATEGWRSGETGVDRSGSGRSRVEPRGSWRGTGRTTGRTGVSRSEPVVGQDRERMTPTWGSTGVPDRPPTGLYLHLLPHPPLPEQEGPEGRTGRPVSEPNGSSSGTRCVG